MTLSDWAILGSLVAVAVVTLFVAKSCHEDDDRTQRYSNCVMQCRFDENQLPCMTHCRAAEADE